MEHEFTKKIMEILKDNFAKFTNEIFSNSWILQYINLKTKSASKGSKARGSFASLYAIYVLIEDYVLKGFQKTGNYSEYEGVQFSYLFKRQRELPFGQKLQNHALNHRMNQEFKKFFPTCDFIPILRDTKTNRYWFNENLIKAEISGKKFNLAKTIIQIIDAYVEAKKDSFEKFIKFCVSAKKLKEKELIEFINSLVMPNIDARVFEIVSYCILKYYYHNQNIYWGFELDKIKEDNLKLYKTGRTNANDGGIDFVMKPLGRFFQVTETVDVDKYFLDIDKIEKYPITFVIKSSDSIESLKQKIQQHAKKQYAINAIVDRYMECIEEVINIQSLLDRFTEAVKMGHLNKILQEIIRQSKIEFNYEDDFDMSDYEDVAVEQMELL